MAQPFVITAGNIKFPIPANSASALPNTTAPASPVVTGLAGMAAKPETRQALVCFEILDETAQKAAQADAEELFPQMLENTQIVMMYGKDAVATLNALVDKLMKEVEDIDIPELKDLMEGLRTNMRRIKNKWDVSDPEVLERVRNWATKGRDWWHQGMSLLEALSEDVMDMEQQLDKVVAELSGKYIQLLRNTGFLDEIYKTNELEVLKLVYRIAVMERIVEVAKAANDKIVVDPMKPSDRNKGEEKRLITELGNNMEIRIGEFKNRLFVGWATSPQTTNMRTLDVGLAMKIDLLISLTIPTMKLTIVQWRLLIQSMQGAEMEQVVAETANEWILAYAKAGAEGVKLVADAVETPTLRPDTITAMADLVASEADSILEARNKGRGLRKEVSQAILSGFQTMATAQGRLTDAAVDKVVAATSGLSDRIGAIYPDAAPQAVPA